MNINFSGINLHIQIIPIYGLSIGILYYDPYLELNNEEDILEEEFYSQITIMFLFFGIHITFWRE